MRLRDIETEDVIRELLAWGVTSLPVSVATAVEYACGRGAKGVSGTVIGLMRAAYHAPHPALRPEVIQILGSNAGDLDTAFDVVMFAAWCRRLLNAGFDVTTKQLAALSSMAHGSVKIAGTRGSLKISRGRVNNAEARRWLAARGVPGFEQEAGE